LQHGYFYKVYEDIKKTGDSISNSVGALISQEIKNIERCDKVIPVHSTHIVQQEYDVNSIDELLYTGFCEVMGPWGFSAVSFFPGNSFVYFATTCTKNTDTLLNDCILTSEHDLAMH